MDPEQKTELLLKTLEDVPASLSTEQAAKVLGISRRTVDRLIEAGHLEWFPANPDTERPDKRVSKAAIVHYMANKPKRKEEIT